MMHLDSQEICSSIVECYPYPIVFADTSHTIRYLNRAARYHYYEERGHADLVGRSIFDCHQRETSRTKIENYLEFFQKDSKELFLGLSDRNLRIYVAPVRNAEGTLIGYYERFELNLQKGS